jgi:hypothetical protein
MQQLLFINKQTDLSLEKGDYKFNLQILTFLSSEIDDKQKSDIIPIELVKN